MSVLIKGMEMPTSCHACCFFGQADIWESDFDGYTKSYCKRTGSQTFDYVDKILPNCPLIHVPPHGRLGDLDELERDFREDAKGPWNMRAMPMNWADAFEEVADIVADAPTIIEAEEATQKDGGQDETQTGPYDLLYEEGGYNSNGV